MWSLNLQHIQLLRGAGGERLAAFFDPILRGEARRAGVAQADVHTQLRQNVGDGGVDSRVDQPMPGGMGYTEVPTAWQYKAVDQPDLSVTDLEGEMNKPEATRLIQAGYGYRVVTTAAVPPDRVTQIETSMLEVAHVINPGAPAPRIVAPDKIAEWAMRFPMAAVAARLISPVRATTLPIWKTQITDATPNYTDNPAWQAAIARIDAHLDFVGRVGDVCLPIAGPSGVGKTRLVYERLARMPGAEALVAYAFGDDEAWELASAVQHGDAAAILVADDCSLDMRVRLSDRLRGARDRVRVVCLDNLETANTGAPVIELALPEREHVVQVLRDNFPAVPDDRRHSYAALAGGYIRLAADLCASDAEITAGGALATGSVAAYVHSRILGQNMEAAALLALFTKVGFRDGLEEEAASVEAVSGVSVVAMREAVRTMRNLPGFLAVQGRYWVVTPEIVARVLFAEGWRRFVEMDPPRFLTALDPEMRDRLVERTRLSGSMEASEVIAATFREWLAELAPADLADARTAEQLASLVELFPKEGVPVLARLVATASSEELLAIKGGPGQTRTGWGARRALVWLCERLAAFPEYWAFAEQVLFRLACHETELDIGNNATALWAQIHRSQLSGTATPFEERFAVFAERARAASPDESGVILAGMKDGLPGHSTRMGGPPTFAGRVRPNTWNPTRGQHRRAAELLTELMIEVREQIPGLAQPITDLAAERLQHLVHAGLLQQGMALIEPDLGSAKVRADAISVIKSFLRRERERWPDPPVEVQGYWSQCEAALQTLAPTDFSSRLRVLLSRPVWGEEVLDEDRRARPAIQELAQEVIDAPDLLRNEIEWLHSPEATAAVVFGEELGRRDRDGVLLDDLVQAANATNSTGLLRGYLVVHRGATGALQERLRERTAQLAAEGSLVAVDMIVAGGDVTGGPEVLLGMTDSGLLAPKLLGAATYGVGGRRLTAEEANEILQRFAGGTLDAETQSAALRIMSAFTAKSPIIEPDDDVQRDRREALIWEILRRCDLPERSGDAYEWKDLMLLVLPAHPNEGVDLFVRALGAESFTACEQAELALTQIAGTYSTQIMNSLGRALLVEDDAAGWLRVRQLTGLVAVLNPADVGEWLDSAGLAGARVLARHLPAPHLDEAGSPVVPAVLELVLSRFEDDDETFRAFVGEVHAHEGWTGNGAARFRAQADVARQFLGHPIRRVREWAQIEIRDREWWAEREAREHAEWGL